MPEKFELVRLLDAGVYSNYHARVIDPELRVEWGVEEVVLKIPNSGYGRKLLLKDIEFYSRYPMESPYIVQYLGFDIFKDQNVLGMKYTDAKNLYYALGLGDGMRRVSVTIAVGIVECILKALTIIHEANIIHTHVAPFPSPQICGLSEYYCMNCYMVGLLSG
jgi:serine/threonine protein kinase